METDYNNISKICIGWWYFEPLFFYLCDEWRNNNKYCESMQICLIKAIKYINAPTEIQVSQDNQDILPDEYKLSPEDNKLLELLFYNAYVDDKDGTDNGLLTEIIETVYKNMHEDDEEITHNDVLYELFCDGNRYTTLNLDNLKGIGTIEVRLKQGSTDPTEINAWIQLISTFFSTLLSLPNTVAKLYNSKPEFKKLSWNLNRYFICKVNNQGEEYDGHKAECLSILFKEMFDLIGSPNLHNYWKNIFENRLPKTNLTDTQMTTIMNNINKIPAEKFSSDIEKYIKYSIVEKRSNKRPKQSVSKSRST
jgi:hypothetical protein